jgi:hypothetical protein
MAQRRNDTVKRETTKQSLVLAPLRHCVTSFLRAGIVVILVSVPAFGQTVLNADGPGNTYELINSVFAPNGGDVVEHPECVHPEFGRHISEVWDATLGQYVFEFTIHRWPDNDRCINFDRQRMEIKTYDASPDSMKGVVGETITYRWKFRLAEGFQSSTSFTHLHQIKPVGGDDGDPLFTLTARKGSPNRMELRHNNSTNVDTEPLSSFLGVWVECTQTITVGANGAYAMTVKRVSDGATLMSYSSSNIMTIRPDNGFIRPKWGIYRSLLDSTSLRDDTVRFAGFEIQESTPTVSVGETSPVPQIMELRAYPNPFNPVTMIEFVVEEEGEATVETFDASGRCVATLFNGWTSAGVPHRAAFDGSGLASGSYLVRLTSGGRVRTTKLALMR